MVHFVQSTNDKLCKFQFPRFGGIKRTSSPSEVASKQSNARSSSPLSVPRASYASQWATPSLHIAGYPSLPNRDIIPQNTSKSQGNLIRPPSITREEESQAVLKKQRCVLEAVSQVDVPVSQPSQASPVSSYASKYSCVRKPSTDLPYMRREDTPTSVSLLRLDQSTLSDTDSSQPLTIVKGSMSSQMESSLNVISSQKESPSTSNGIIHSQMENTANGTKASQLEVTSSKILSSQHEPAGDIMVSHAQISPSSTHSDLVVSKSSGTPSSRQKSTDNKIQNLTQQPLFHKVCSC